MNINYSNVYWYLKIPDNKKEWDILVTMCENVGISFLNPKYESQWNYLVSSGVKDAELARNSEHNQNLTEVSFYEMIDILTNVKEDKQALQVAQLEKIITKTIDQLNFLKTNINL